MIWIHWMEYICSILLALRCHLQRKRLLAHAHTHFLPKKTYERLKETQLQCSITCYQIGLFILSIILTFFAWKIVQLIKGLQWAAHIVIDNQSYRALFFSSHSIAVFFYFVSSNFSWFDRISSFSIRFFCHFTFSFQFYC